MGTTIFLVSLLLILLFVALLLWAFFLRLGLRWARVEGVTLRRVAAATMLACGANLAFSIACDVVVPPKVPVAILVLFSLAELIAGIVAQTVPIMLVFKARFLRSLQAWLATLVPSLGMVFFAILVLRPFVVEAFVIPTNAMAPTLLGKHWQGVCPECGRPSFCSPSDRPGNADGEAPLMICRDFHVCAGKDIDYRVDGGDRIVVLKSLKPRRWDLVVFRYPENPSIFYVMRLVGLPGEDIRIEDGAVWANDQKLTPPEPIRGITYLSEIPGAPYLRDRLWGTRARPAKLGADEYFMLGDFSAMSKDSRLWEDGAPGHPAFAVPQSYLHGVVTHIYWPPERWRILR